MIWADDGISDLDVFIDEIMVQDNSKTNIGLALEEALDILDNSAESGDTSLCKKPTKKVFEMTRQD